MFTFTLDFISTHKFKFCLACIWIFVLTAQPEPILLLRDYIAFTFLGVLGAVFANATGAGGGVVFVPFFNQLALSNTTIVATSFAIQCCGMTAGALTWWRHYRKMHTRDLDWQGTGIGLGVAVPLSIIGILTAQFLISDYTDNALSSLPLYFGIFSILLSLAIYGSIPLMKRNVSLSHLTSVDLLLLAVIAFAGGIVTAWLSVGVGELVAVYLILRGFNTTFAIAVAVILSAFTVWGAIPYHLFVSNAVYWQIVIFAGAGAIIGGMIAKYVVLYFSPVRLKVFFATWVLIMGLTGLPVWS
ncbi:MAG: sulfite exporter TauE/SafE family protein [Pseudomonadota bacterium]